MKKYINDNAKYIKFFISLGLFFFGGFIKYIPILIFKIDINNMSNLTNISLTLFSNLISFSILVFMFRKNIINGIKELKTLKWKPLSKSLDYWFIGLMIMVISNYLISLINKGATSTNEESIRLMLKEFPIITTLSIAFLAPIIEELVFRQSFKDIFKNKWVYLATSGLLFGALHVVMSPIYSPLDYLYLIPYCSMGVAFSYICYKSNNIINSIIMHILHNSLNVISTLIFVGVIL